ncbi:hypothetical protein [Kytococcus sp. Marseille-QA3725]
MCEETTGTALRFTVEGEPVRVEDVEIQGCLDGWKPTMTVGSWGK